MRNIAIIYKQLSCKFQLLKDQSRLVERKWLKKKERSDNYLLKSNDKAQVNQKYSLENQNQIKSESLEKFKVSATPVLTAITTKTEKQENKYLKKQRVSLSDPWNKLKEANIFQSKFKWKLFEKCKRIEDFLKTSNRQKIIHYGAAGAAVTVSESNKTETVSKTDLQDNIPEPPPIPEVFPETLNQLNELGEPTLESLGLGGWSPIGLVQSSLEYIHVTLHLPWWQTIVIGTIVVRTLMFPLVIIAQRNAAKMNNYLPQLQVLQLKMTEARQTGNHLEVARYSQEMMSFMKEKGLNPLKNMLVPLAQMPLFISFFMGLRQMANAPVESMRHGGILWFTDLCVPDQYFGLPLITSLTLWATIELGTDAARLSSQNLQVMKYVLRALPVIIFPFTINFPGAILCYWVSTNFISLLQVGFLRIPAVRDFFKIEQLIIHRPENLPIKSKGFVGGIKDSWTNIKVSKELEERQRFDELQFRRAGRGPVVKTYKYDPTKPPASQEAVISAKKR